MTNPKLQQIIESLQSITENDSSEALRQVYDEWAASYDTDLESLGYVAPLNAVRFFVDALAEEAPHRDGLILDAGCGTGLVGRYLSELGYTNLHGIDISQEMLDEAAVTNAYSTLAISDLSTALHLDSNCYHAATCVGVMGPRLTSEPLVPELVRVVKPGGLIQIVIRDEWYTGGTEQVVRQLIKQDVVELVQNASAPYFVEREIGGRFLTLRKVTRVS